MSIVTQLVPDVNDPTTYWEKLCTLKLMELTPEGDKPVGIIQFNLLDFISIDPKQLLKLEFHKSHYEQAIAIISVNSSDPQDSKTAWDVSPITNKVVDYKKYQDLKAKFLKSEAQKHDIVNQANTKITRMVTVHQEAVKEKDLLEEKL